MVINTIKDLSRKSGDETCSIGRSFTIKCIHFYQLHSHRSKNISKLRKLEDKILNNKQLKKSQILKFQAKLRSSYGNKFFEQLPAHHPKNNAYLSR